MRRSSDSTNYQKLVSDPAFLHALALSLLFTAGSLLFQFTIGFALALFFNRPFPGNGPLRALLLLAWLLPTVVSGSLFRWMLDGDYGVLNFALVGLGLLSDGRYWLIDPGTALAGTILANVWVGIPFNMALLLAGLQGIPAVLYEAARVDGASAWQQFRSLTLPLMRPVALSVLLLGLIYTFKVFDLIYVMTKGGPVDATTTLPIYTYKLTFEFFRFGDGAAAATLLLLGLVVVALVYLWALAPGGNGMSQSLGRVAARRVRLDAGWHTHRHRLPLPRLLDGLDLAEVPGGDLRHPADTDSDATGVRRLPRRRRRRSGRGAGHRHQPGDQRRHDAAHPCPRGTSRLWAGAVTIAGRGAGAAAAAHHAVATQHRHCRPIVRALHPAPSGQFVPGADIGRHDPDAAVCRHRPAALLPQRAAGSGGGGPGGRRDALGLVLPHHPATGTTGFGDGRRLFVSFRLGRVRLCPVVERPARTSSR